MELNLQQVNNTRELIIPEAEIVKPVSNNFIEANTIPVSFSHLKEDCITPVFSKDNECTIAHNQFVEAAYECTNEVFRGQNILSPALRVSHTVKGRIPSAIGKPANTLLEEEKTIYYERMMFAIEIPSISKNINGNELSLVIGGVRAYNQENLYSRKSVEKFKVFIGFKNKVCTNLCIATDGYKADIRVTSIEELKSKILELITHYDMDAHLNTMSTLSKYKLTEKQFAQLIGRLRLYNYIPKNEKVGIPQILLNDGQINSVARDYYQDENFRRDVNGDISLWNLYNLFTGSNKSSYIDTFLDRSTNAFEVTHQLSHSLEHNTNSWYLN